MINLIRSQSRILLTFLLVIIGLSFIVFYNIPSIEGIQRGTYGKIDGQDISQDNFQIAHQATTLIFTLSTGGQMPRGGQMDEILYRQSWNRLIMLSYAKELGVQVPDSQVIEFIRGKLPFLQEKGVFQPALYEKFAANFLQEQGISTDRFAEIIREELILEKVRSSIAAPVHVSAAEVAAVYEKQFGLIKMAFVTLSRSAFLPQVRVTPEEIEKEYQANGTNPDYSLPPKRKVSFASFRLTPDKAKLPAAEREEALRRLYDQAENFTVALVSGGETAPDFNQIATTFQASTGTTELFAEHEAPKPLPLSPAFNRAAFNLSDADPVSQPVQVEDGFYVLKLVESVASLPRPLAEVRAKVEQNLRIEKASALVLQEGQKAAVQLKEAVAQGTPFRQAAAALKLKVEEAPEFSPGSLRSEVPVLRTLASLTQTLQPGEVSSFMPNAEGGVIAYFAERKPAPRDQAEIYGIQIIERVKNQRRSQLLEEWIKARYRAPGTKVPPQLLKETAPEMN
jgi:peptidyl-prolyl cis-trans isomerase D